MRKRKKLDKDIINNLTTNEIVKIKKELNNSSIFDYELSAKNDYEEFLERRKKIVNSLSDKEIMIMEVMILKGVIKMLKNAKKDAQSDDLDKGFFRYEDLLAIPYVSDYFNIIVVNGDRNIGKSWSSKRMIRDIVSKKNKRFMIWRNTEESVRAQVESDIAEGGFLSQNNFKIEGSKKSPNILDKDGNLVGYYRAVNTNTKFKSVDFPDTDLIVYEEYSDNNIGDKAFKMINFMSTVQRQNTNLKVLLQANYTDQNDPILQFLGVGAKKLKTSNTVMFNWVIGALIINIPRGIYRKPKDDLTNVAERAALGKFEIWKSQYGGGFSNEEPINIIEESEIINSEPIFNIYTLTPTSVVPMKGRYGAHKITFYKCALKNGSHVNVVRDQILENDRPIFVFDDLNLIRYPKAHLLELEKLKYLINLWNQGKLKTLDINTHALVSGIFAMALKHIRRDEDFAIEDINNIIKN